MERIAGPLEELRPLYEKLKSWTSKNYEENGFGKNWLGNIVGFAGFTRADLDKENGYPCRGEIIEPFYLKELDNTDGVIFFQSLTAWIPLPAMWYAIVDKYAPHCRYYYYSEEPGCNIYESNDVYHKFFADEYTLDFCAYDEEKIPEKYKEYFFDTETPYPLTEDCVINMLQRFLETDETDIDKLILRFNTQEREDLKSNGYVGIYKVQYITEYEY